MYTNSTIQGAAGSARRVWEVLGTETQVADKPGALPLAAETRSEPSTATAATGAQLRAATRPRGHVRIEHVTFGYEPGRPVLRNISLEVAPGQTLALVGATGAGKSTLVSLVPRFFEF